MDKNSAIQLIKQCEIELKDQFSRLDDIALYNQEKVLDAYKNQSIQARHMFGTTGYGYDDIGRDTLCRLYADIFHAESAIVSPNIVSGTHALTLMLFGVLRPGDKLLAISGMPYDTLTDVILAENKGSLRDFGVKFDKIDLKTNPDLTPEFDREAIKIALENEPIKAVFLARSRGYSLRQAISVEKVGEIIAFVKKSVRKHSFWSIIATANSLKNRTDRRRRRFNCRIAHQKYRWRNRADRRIRRRSSRSRRTSFLSFDRAVTRYGRRLVRLRLFTVLSRAFPCAVSRQKCAERLAFVCKSLH